MYYVNSNALLKQIILFYCLLVNTTDEPPHALSQGNSMSITYSYIYNIPKTKKFGCVGRGDLTSLSKVAK